jgi:hypothetical protein
MCRNILPHVHGLMIFIDEVWMKKWVNFILNVGKKKKIAKN